MLPHSFDRITLAVTFTLLLGACGGEDIVKPPIEPPDEPIGLWFTAGTLPAPIHSFGAAVYQDRIYVAGGDDELGRSQNGVYRLDPGTGQWETLHVLPQGRTNPSLVTVGDSLYVAGGIFRIFAAFELPVELLVYRPDLDIWEERAALPSPRMEAAGVALNGELYLIGGVEADRQFTPGDSVAVYNPTLDAWRHEAPPLHARSKATAVPFGDRIYLVGGELPLNLSAPVVQIEAYDPVAGAWSDVSSLASVRSTTGIALRGTSIHVVGGVASNLDDTTLHEALDLTTLTWTEPRGLPSTTARRDHRAAVLTDQLFVLGGRQRLGPPTDLVQRFDPNATTRTH